MIILFRCQKTFGDLKEKRFLAGEWKLQSRLRNTSPMKIKRKKELALL